MIRRLKPAVKQAKKSRLRCLERVLNISMRNLWSGFISPTFFVQNSGGANRIGWWCSVVFGFVSPCTSFRYRSESAPLNFARTPAVFRPRFFEGCKISPHLARFRVFHPLYGGDKSRLVWLNRTQNWLFIDFQMFQYPVCICPFSAGNNLDQVDYSYPWSVYCYPFVIIGVIRRVFSH